MCISAGTSASINGHCAIVVGIGEGSACGWCPEYVIIHKLEFLREGGSEKHVRDIRGMLAVTDVDRALLEKKVKSRGLGEYWERVQPGSGG